MRKFQLQSGKIVEMNLATTPQALTLYRAIVYECKNAGLDISSITFESIGNVLLKNIDAILNIIGSELVFNAIEGCCEKVIYDGQHYNIDIFEDEKAKGDYFGLMLLVATENIRPFFPSLHSLFTALTATVVK